MNYFKTENTLVVVQQEVVKTKVVNWSKGVNHLAIWDRSGSMYGALEQLTEDLKKQLRTAKVGDTISLGWFSGEGDFNWPLKGFKVTDKADFTTLDKIIDQNNTTRGTTCFSDILSDSEKVVTDLLPFGNTFSLMFLTDGHPVVSDYTKELVKITEAIERVAGKITTSLLVGYGNYYNKELMSKMAEKFGGTLIHQSDLSTFKTNYGEFMERSRKSEPKVFVELHAQPHPDGFAFAVTDNNISVLAVDENNGVAFTPTTAKTDYVYTVTNKKPSSGSAMTIDTLDEHMIKAVYGAALGFVQRGKTELALEVLSTLGDVGLVNAVNNAFTNAEYGNVEAAISKAIGSPTGRLLNGRKVGCLPKTDAFCLLDVMDILMADDQAEFWPQHEEFSYTKIGVGSKTKDGFPKFNADADARVPMTGLVWHDSKLNLSVRAKIDGTIDLKDGPSVGLDKTFDTFVWRNYTIVKDGFLNTTKLPVSMSKASYSKLLEEGLIDKEHNRHYAGQPYVLHLDRVPVVNRAIAQNFTSAVALCENAYTEMQLMSDMKVLNYLRNEVEPKTDRGLNLGLTEKQEEFLKELGVTRNGYAPPVYKMEPTDFYMAKEFNIKVKGLSSIPKVDDVLAKTASKGTLTASAQLVADSLAMVSKVYKPGDAPATKNKVVLSKLDSLTTSTKAKLQEIRTNMQKAKFAIVLAKQSWSDFNSRAGSKLTVDGQEFTLEITETKVEI